MSIRTLLRRGLIAAAMLSAPALATDTSSTMERENTARTRAAFEAWRAGTGTVFDLLDPQAVWTVAGHSPVSGTYRSKQVFMDRAVAPITARLATRITPDVKQVMAQGDAVTVLWDGTATTVDGDTYRNSYAWHMVFDEGRIVHVTAFLDTWALQQLME
ncbi:nuclear transport factor 2 family protein [Pseudoxanthomonas sp.]|uniref:nuclear transport factor 2 family protein n=1 Tax=Pseudoxanthomonas sp. TaxID=1871049 RepID=UPI002FE16287